VGAHAAAVGFGLGKFAAMIAKHLLSQMLLSGTPEDCAASLPLGLPPASS
jgi:hypothetical protein